MSDKQKLVLSIIDFLNLSINDGTVKADDKESLEIAVQCIGEAFGVDSTDAEQVKKLSVKPTSLQNIFDVYLKTQDKFAQGASSSTQSISPGSAAPSAEDNVKAEKLKSAGNSQMTAKKYDEAIESYTQAIALNSNNPIYYSNRAAAYSNKGDHLSAVGDAEAAIAVDPNYVKAYHRLGHAQYSLGDFKAAADAFNRGLELDPTNAGLFSALQSAKARIVDDNGESHNSDSQAASTSSPAAPAGGMPDLSSMANMMRGMGMGGEGGGMPDIAAMMNNPQMMAMAQQMMGNGGLANLMQNPAVASMMARMQNGDMPSMSELMSDPTLRNMASQFGGAGR